MAESFLKSKNRRFSGSLAARVLLVVLVFLVIPFFLDTLLTSYFDVRSKEENILSTLRLMGQERAELVQEAFLYEKNTLDAVDFLLSSEEKLLPLFFQKLSEKEDVQQIFLMQKRGTEFFVTISSKDVVVPRVYQGKGFSNGSGVYLEGDSLFVVKQVPTREGFLVMEVSPGLLLKKVSISKDLSTQTRSSILDKNGRVIVSTDSSLKGKDFKLGSTDEKGDIKLRPLKLENGVLFTTNGKEKIAAIQRVEGTPLYLLIDTTHAVLSAAMLRYLQRLLSLVLVILIVGGVGTFWLVRRFAKPLNNLCYVMDRAAQGDLSARFTPDRMGFEINVVGGVFNQMIDTLLAKMEEVKNERVKKETLERELQLGHDVQRALFPKQLPEFKGLELAADSESAKEVGGDFYDLYPIPDSSKLLITIADVSGKGINACFFSLMARSLLRSFASASCELKSIVQQTNDLFLKDASPSSVFVTAWVGIYDASTMQIAYTNCGHLPALLKKSGQPIEKLTTPGMALGVLPMEDVSIKNFTLSPMDTLVLFTDGVTDAQNPQDEMFGEERLLSLIEEKSGFGAHDLLGVIYQKLRAFSEGAALYDDLTLLILNKCY